MTSPRPYGSGYPAPAFPDTPIYDSLVAERGTPQIAPIRVPSYDTGSHLPALPAPRAALPPAAPASATPPYGYQQPAAHAPQHPATFVPQQQAPPQWEQRPRYEQPAHQSHSAPPPATHPGYEAMRPVAPRPVPAQQAHPYPEQYARPYYGDGQRY